MMNAIQLEDAIVSKDGSIGPADDSTRQGALELTGMPMTDFFAWLTSPSTILTVLTMTLE
jgi:hypothetical protein